MTVREVSSGAVWGSAVVLELRLEPGDPGVSLAGAPTLSSPTVLSSFLSLSSCCLTGGIKRVGVRIKLSLSVLSGQWLPAPGPFLYLP